MSKYSKEFKEEAIRLSDEIGNKKAAAQLGLPYYTLADWRNKSKHKPKEPELSNTELKIRNRELERENAELRQANEILKDALGAFAPARRCHCTHLRQVCPSWHPLMPGISTACSYS